MGVIDFWNMKYKPGGEYRRSDGTIYPNPYWEKDGVRYSIGGVCFVWVVIALIMVLAVTALAT